MTIKEWVESIGIVWPILGAAITALFGFVLGNDRAKNKLATVAQELSALKSDVDAYKVAAKKDADGIGGKVTILAGEAREAKMRCDRAREDHEKLEREFRADHDARPEREKNLRHEIIDTLNGAILKVDDRVDELRDDVRDLKRT